MKQNHHATRFRGTDEKKGTERQYLCIVILKEDYDASAHMVEYRTKVREASVFPLMVNKILRTGLFYICTCQPYTTQNQATTKHVNQLPTTCSCN